MKLNIEETLSAQTYAAYMIASSYFGSYVCATRQLERQSYMLYRMLGEKAQGKMEDRIILLMEKKVLPHVGKEFLRSRVEVQFLPDGRGILITDGLEALVIRLTPSMKIVKDDLTGVEQEYYRIRIGARLSKVWQLPRR